ncbi:Ig-like domain-containing protein [Aphis craccivora]|uniref:Ig-like domain-containing protein n=1 Tax=Aphis craccivora TaxID=307492 RepID=A0A6G0ZI42_APHCR|nr:Ig-like domain-containing protein [Aphis craccivora]
MDFIGSPETMKYTTSNPLQLSKLTVTLKLDQSHFKDGRKLLLQCTALINTLYKQTSELRLPIKSTEPVPEKAKA